MAGVDESLAFLVDLMADEHIDSLGDRFVVGDLLGCGRFSQVRRAKTLPAPGAPIPKDVALKGFALAELDDEEALEMLEAEVNALRRAAKCEELRPYVVRLEAVLSTRERHGGSSCDGSRSGLLRKSVMHSREAGRTAAPDGAPSWRLLAERSGSKAVSVSYVPPTGNLNGHW